MANTFSIGDVVRLKSGRPHMTVTSVYNDANGSPVATCHWFNQSQVQQADFHLDALETVPQSRGGHRSQVVMAQSK
jgi:uncharacterized protein YodC (DUF2158 family)